MSVATAKFLPLSLILLGVLAGCAGQPKPGPTLGEARDGAPPGQVDFDRIPDAVPRVERRSATVNPASYVVWGKRYPVMQDPSGYRERGVASWYGTKFHGRPTASGETYDLYQMTAAHKSLPLPSYARVTNLQNGRSIVVKVNDRGPFVDDRIIDLSYVAAGKLGFASQGTGQVEVEYLDPAAPPPPPATRVAEANRATTRATAGTVADPFYLQVGAFSTPQNADRLRAQLTRTLGTDIRVRPDDGGSPPLFRVQVGPLQDQEAIRNLSLRLAELGFPDLKVVRD
jgi:rare lipoprotein A